MKSRSAPAYVSAYIKIISFFKSKSFPISHLILDNETSTSLTAYFKSECISFQYVAPNDHRTNPAEQAIRTAKNHFISILSSAHISFPPNRWSSLLPMATLTLNHFRHFALDKSISAWHGIYGQPLDFAVHPIHPPGQLVVAHDHPHVRASWARHGTRGFYLAPALNHYRSHRIFTPHSGATRVSNQLDFFPDPLLIFESPPSSPPFPIPLPLGSCLLSMVLNLWASPSSILTLASVLSQGRANPTSFNLTLGTVNPESLPCQPGGTPHLFTPPLPAGPTSPLSQRWRAGSETIPPPCRFDTTGCSRSSRGARCSRSLSSPALSTT
jgi:hypothetical protein